MSKHSKGTRLELKCKKELEKAGWLPEQKNWSRFGGKDFWNCFDVLAIRKGIVLAVQVKSNQARKKEVKENYKRIENHIPVSWRVELWTRKDYEKNWKKFNIKTL